MNLFLFCLKIQLCKNDECKVVGCASSVGLPPAALSPNFLDKRVGTGPASA